MSNFEKQEIGNAVLYCGDCAVVLPTLESVDLVLTDPPYGIGESRDKNASRSKPTKNNPSRIIQAKSYGNDDWDDKPPPRWMIDMVREKGRNAIIFGGNYFELPPTKCWLVWDKENGKSDFADCELAWSNLPKAVRRIRFMWNGMLRDGNEPRGDHPTQKPVAVMEWCISHAPDAATICDPFMGSGTTGVAAMNLERKFIGIERERKYFDIACERISKAQDQLRLAL